MANHYTATLRNAQLAAITTAVGATGFLNLYDGTQPAAGGTATNLLAQFTLANPFAPAASAGVLSPTLPANTTGAIAGTVTWARVTTSGGAWVMDLPVADFTFNSTTISVGVTVSLTGWTITNGSA